MLITAAVPSDVETVARRIHARARARRPFVCVSAATLPGNATVLEGTCANLLDAASGGSLLLTNIEEMPASIQDSVVDTFAELQAARDPFAAVRLIAGTTVSLRDRIASGAFSERLFYRLNIIHIVVPQVDRPPCETPGNGYAR
jgi:DNA-binding NtrC family response regulator